MSNTLNALLSPTTSNVASQPAASSNNSTSLSARSTADIAIDAIIKFIVLAVLVFIVWRKQISSQKDMYRHGAELELQNTPLELAPQIELQELPGLYAVARSHTYVVVNNQFVQIRSL
jgi:hypothetical protein